MCRSFNGMNQNFQTFYRLIYNIIEFARRIELNTGFQFEILIRHSRCYKKFETTFFVL